MNYLKKQKKVLLNICKYQQDHKVLERVDLVLCRFKRQSHLIIKFKNQNKMINNKLLKINNKLLKINK